MSAFYKFQSRIASIILIVLFVSDSIAQNTTFNRDWYIGGWIGTHLNANGDTHIPSILSNPPLKSEPVYQSGSSWQLALGKQMTSSFRLESMLSFQNLPMIRIDNAIGENTVVTVNHSYTNLFSFFINAYYNFNYPTWFIYPYLGIGAGYVKVKNMIRPESPIPVSPGSFFTKKELNYDTWGYQGALGVIYPLSKNFDIDFKYNYFSTLNTKATGQTNLSPDPYQTKQKISNNIVSLGLRYFIN